ncbi:class I SAM-dependent methyltransferase [Dactylosporangium sp. NPDC049140]|uniref:SAM-dependent methyltransferase n=1 Tax=Dactylosporangium sp. NPDC049140 TaxID=3155647 RepID=UPI0033E2494F
MTDTKPSIDQPIDSVDRSELARSGQARISAWSHGAQALALLAAAHERGWLMFLRRPRTPAELATFTGMEDARLAALVGTLEASGVVRRIGGFIELRPEFAELVADDGLYALEDLLARGAAMNRLVGDSVRASEPARPTKEESLAIARGFVWRPGPRGREIYRGMLDALPEFASAIGSGRLLDVGCGVAGAMLTAASMFPGMTGVGLEVEPSVAAEAQRRAAKFGDRIRIIATDARDFDEAEGEGFDACFWAQPFFPADTRADTLRMIRRALKPGGVLIEQEMEVEPQDEDARLGFALRRLVFAGWNVPFARTAEDLRAEATAEDFEHVRIATTSLGRVVVSRRP